MWVIVIKATLNPISLLLRGNVLKLRIKIIWVEVPQALRRHTILFDHRGQIHLISCIPIDLPMVLAVGDRRWHRHVVDRPVVVQVHMQRVLAAWVRQGAFGNHAVALGNLLLLQVNLALAGHLVVQHVARDFLTLLLNVFFNSYLLKFLFQVVLLVYYVALSLGFDTW